MSEITAEMAASVWKIEKAVGDRVEVGDTIMILESMKMEIPVDAEETGTIVEIPVAEGDSIGLDDILVKLSD
ncbi:biotin/lipoyl-binding carrier protein [Rhodococcus daqingensis]|uniref:Biotin/lipoyl-binding carrier protein n=1 Tax=Rhodococcus daqingensis TaxID=2479363 RepID=A0ABW2RUB8_9NOCA